MTPSLPLVSIITPLYQTSERHFDECARSVNKSVKDLEGIAEVEWLVQVDKPEIPEYLSKYKHARIEANPINEGSAQSRNAALARSSGDIIVSVDADDIIVDLRPTVKALIEMPEIGWASGMVLTFHEDGSLRHAGVPWEDEIVPLGGVLDHWEATGRYPFAAAGSYTVRREALQLVGAWPDTRLSEDAIMAAMVSENYKGWFTSHVIHLYRRHPAQKTSQPDRVATKVKLGLERRARLLATRNTENSTLSE